MIVTMCLRFNGEYWENTQEFDDLKNEISCRVLLKKYERKFNAQKVVATLEPPPEDSFSAHAYLKFHFSGVGKNTEEGKYITQKMNNCRPFPSPTSPDSFWLYSVNDEE